MTFGSTFGRTFSPTFQPKSQAAVAVSAFVPTDITGCQLWLDFSDANYLFTDAGSTKVGSDGDAIYQANDKSGSGNHAVQSTAGSRPLYKTNIKNGKSVARFDGTDDWFEAAELVENLEWTLFVVFYQQDIEATGDGVTLYAAQRYDVDGYGAGLRIWSGAAGGNCAHLLMNGGTGTISLVSTNALTYQNWYCHVARCKSGDSAHYTNATANGTSNATISSVYTGYNAKIGGPHTADAKGSLTGDIAEIIWYNSSLSDANRQLVETYLNTKWTVY